MNVIHRLSIAFPRYRLRTTAEFAKEAMSNQALDHKEILSIRWAKDDPNPTARLAIDRADRDAVDAILEAKGKSGSHLFILILTQQLFAPYIQRLPTCNIHMIIIYLLVSP